MRLATMADGTRDGRLVVVSDDGQRHLVAEGIAPTMQAALDAWQQVEPALRALAVRLATGQGDAIDQSRLLAPLPRAWQWLDGSAFPNHGALMQKAFDLPPIDTDKPLMYQGMSHRFLSATEDVSFPSEADGIDFEGEFAIVTDDVPMGCPAAEALAHVRLVLLLNDWSLRSIAPIEMKTGFGWVQAKPACSVAPFAVTPDELGEAWCRGRVCLPLTVEVNGVWFGSPSGAAMAFGFDDLIAHAARTRDLPAGTIIGSGTVSNMEHARVGSTCISERRAIDVIAGRAPMPFLRFGDRVHMAAVSDSRSTHMRGRARMSGFVDGQIVAVGRAGAEPAICTGTDTCRRIGRSTRSLVPANPRFTDQAGLCRSGVIPSVGFGTRARHRRIGGARVRVRHFRRRCRSGSE